MPLAVDVATAADPASTEAATAILRELEEQRVHNRRFGLASEVNR